MSHEVASERTPTTLTSVAWRFSAADHRSEAPVIASLGWLAPPETDPADGAGLDRSTVRLDGSRWSGWWRDLIVERYRVAMFDQLVPLPDPERCPWAHRVGLGRVVEGSLVGVHGPDVTACLVAEALELSGFGVPGGLGAPDRPRRRIRPFDPDCGGDDELRHGVLGTIADALLREVPPAVAQDLHADPPGAEDGDTVIEDVVAAATRRAVLAYAHHVEDLATRSRLAVRAQQI